MPRYTRGPIGDIASAQWLTTRSVGSASLYASDRPIDCFFALTQREFLKSQHFQLRWMALLFLDYIGAVLRVAWALGAPAPKIHTTKNLKIVQECSNSIPSTVETDTLHCLDYLPGTDLVNAFATDGSNLYKKKMEDAPMAGVLCPQNICKTYKLWWMVLFFLNFINAAELAATRKTDKYNSLVGIYIVQPLAFNTVRPINSSDLQFLMNQVAISREFLTTDVKPLSFCNVSLFASNAAFLFIFRTTGSQGLIVAPAVFNFLFQPMGD